MALSSPTSSALRVALFVGAFPVVSETFVLRHITSLLDAGHDVDIFADTRGDPAGPVHPEIRTHRLLERTTYMDMPPEAAPWEIPIWPLHGLTWPPGSAQPVRNWTRLRRALPVWIRSLMRAPRLTLHVMSGSEYGFQAASLSALYRLHQITRRRRAYDVLHAHFGPVGNSFRFARRWFRAPLVVTFHGYDFCAVPRKQGRDVYRKLFAVADAVTVNSRYTREQVLPLGCPEGRLHHLPMGVDLSQFPFRERRRVAGQPVRVLTVARLVPVKGHAFALQAMAQLRASVPDLRWDIVGEGPERAALEQQVGRLGLREVVRFHGSCDRGGLERWMQQCDLFLLPSITVDEDREGQGLVVQEAQASGMPVIVTAHGGLPEGLLPGQSGLVVPEGDVGVLADQLGWLVRHSERWPALGRCGREYVEKHFDVRQLTGRLVDIYHAARTHFTR